MVVIVIIGLLATVVAINVLPAQGKAMVGKAKADISTLEQAIEFIDDDELVEVTPKSIRIRKLYLDPHERKRASRAKVAA